MSETRTMDGGRALHVARAVSGALAGGVLVYAGVAWYLVRSGAVAPLDHGVAEVVKQTWIVVIGTALSFPREEWFEPFRRLERRRA